MLVLTWSIFVDTTTIDAPVYLRFYISRFALLFNTKTDLTKAVKKWYERSIPLQLACFFTMVTVSCATQSRPFFFR